nr:hypothetical protein [Tanacetum cinerariifolium]
MGHENSSVSGVVVGYTQLKDAIDTIIIDCHVPTFASRDRRGRWKPHLVIIIVMVLKGMRFKPLSLSFSGLMRLETMILRLARDEKRPKSMTNVVTKEKSCIMLVDQQAKAEAKVEDKANRRKQDELISVDHRMAELLSHLGSQNEMGSGSGTVCMPYFYRDFL